MSRRFLAVALVLGLLPLAGVALAGGGQSGFSEARQATAAFHDIEAAKAAGYVATVADLAGIECIAHAEDGAMGHIEQFTPLGAETTGPAVRR